MDDKMFCFDLCCKRSWLEYNVLKRWPLELVGNIYEKSYIDLIIRNVGYPDTRL
jgi:hypothetical protein